MATTPDTELALSPLSKEEKRDWKRLQRVVCKGIESQWEMGAALMEINRRKLYRDDYSTFADYLQDQHEMSKTRGYQLIDASEVRTQLEKVHHGGHLPGSERQCRELAVVPADELPKVWEQVLQAASEQDIPVTAKLIRQHTAEYRVPVADSLDRLTSESDRRLERVSVFLRREVDNCPPVNLPELRFLVQRIIDRIPIPPEGTVSRRDGFEEELSVEEELSAMLNNAGRQLSGQS